VADFKTDFAIHLDGNKLQGEEAGAILGIRVFQTRSGASAFEVVVSDPDLKWQGKPTFTECKEVKIELGEAGKLKQVFDGEVTAWRTELERSGPTVLVLRGLDRSHRMMRAKKTKTYANASPIDCANQIAADYGLTAKTRAGAPPPVKTFRFQANQTDFEFLRQMADLEGYMFFIEGSELHFERPQIPSNDDAEFTFGQEVKTFLPVANFRKPAPAVEVGAWDVSGKGELTGKAQTGDELWSVPGVKPGANLAKFTSTKPEVSLVESQVGTQEHADTVAKAALTKRAMQFITAEVEVQGNPKVKPGALVNIKKVGPYSGHYLVTEANHFYDSAGYNCIFYVARDKWGNSSQPARQAPPAQQPAPAQQQQAQPAVVKDGIHRRLVDEDTGHPLANVEYEIVLHGGEKRRGKTDSNGYLEENDVPAGNFVVHVLVDEAEVFEPPPVTLSMEAGDERPAHAAESSSSEPARRAAVHIGAVSVDPPRAFQGDSVKLSAELIGAADGSAVVFRIFPLEGGDALAEVEATVASERAEASWKLPALAETGKQDGFAYADLDVEVDFAGLVRRAVEVPALRAFLGPAFFLSTVIRSIGGTPLMNQRVQVIDPDTGESVGEPVTTDEEGHIAVPVPENKKYGVRILDDDPGDDVPPPEAMDPYDPAVDDPPRIFVRLLDDAGGPLAAVNYELKGKDGFSHAGTTDAEGDIEMEGVPAGAYELSVQGKTFQVPTLLSSVLRDDPAPYTLVVAGAKKACFLSTQIRATGGTPLMHQQVQVVDPDTGEPVGDPVTTDAEGRIAVEVPQNKKYGIRILDDEPGDDVPPPEAMDPYDPAQDDPPRIFVRVLDANGKPLAGVDYEVTGKGGFSHKGKTDAEGDVEMEGVPAGSYELKIQGRKFQIPTIVSSVLREDPTPYTLIAK
jgi:phage protein D